MISMGLLLASCSDESALSFPEDMHANERAIVSTTEFDAQLEELRQGGVMTATVFQTETELLIREQALSSTTSSKSTETPTERKAYFGDLHVHTTYSFDGYAFGTLATPYDAYRFAKGEAIANPAGFNMQLPRPLDFYAVTDHAMFLGVVKAAADTSTEFSKNEFSEPYHDLNAPENMAAGLFSILNRFSTFAGFLPDAISQITSGELDRNEVLSVVRSSWSDSIDAADQFNDPGNFTTFAAYEYTSSTADMGNLHRNVIFEGTDQLPREPFSRFHSVNPEDLWQWMDELRAKGVDSLAIPHNSNGANGQMFKLVDWAGNPLDDDYAKQRIRNEPIVEITQIKGTSETHPVLSSRDEWAGFEIMPYRVATNALSQLEGSYVREALLNGITLEQEGMTNPYQFGFIGSSDTHSAASQNSESNFVSKLGLLSGTAEQRGSVPQTGLEGEFGYQVMKALGRGGSRLRINGDVYVSGAAPTFGASGLAAAWAEENTRESLYSAFRRKEVFATSGPRMQIRLFAGYGFDEKMLTEADGIERAYAGGVTMGGTLLPYNSTEGEQATETAIPGFLIMASADTESAPLQRLQIVKGWIDAEGTHEEVIDVSCAGRAIVNPDTNRCPNNGAQVDISDCSINAETGAGQLSALWRDPEFKREQRAFYYARVIENPTCRWSTWDANRAGVTPRPDLPTTVQERAWSSPIHYLPE
ncbi:MAG: DUF3604 domain-containing protein [Gammaproteobacteria bacterium]|nr:DUF3604 domain-containing protein [Gammaproteobacteria bacterium]MBT5601352.1 DUF3604 domain-containing protein [Gammaproteobacteria bacterium]